MRPALPEAPEPLSGETEAMAIIVSDLIRAGLLRPPPAPLAWPDFVFWFKRTYAPGFRTPSISAALRVALGPGAPPAPPAPPAGALAPRPPRVAPRGPWAAPALARGRRAPPGEEKPLLGRLVRPADLDGGAMLARLASRPRLARAPAGAFERLPDDVLETACAYGSLLDLLSLRAAGRRFAGLGELSVRSGVAALARADLDPVRTLVAWAVRLFGDWSGVRAQRLANRLASSRAGFDRNALFDLWVRGQWDAWTGFVPEEGGGPARQGAIRALRERVATARLTARAWLETHGGCGTLAEKT